MLDFLKKNRLRIAFGIVFIGLFFLLITQVESKRRENWVSYIVQNLSYPFVTFSHFVSSNIVDMWTHYIYLIGVMEENDQLKQQVRELEEIKAQNREFLIAYKRLQETLRFHTSNPDEKIFAEVTGEITKGFSKLLIINKGSNHGIKKNFAVVTHEGIVGKVQSVTPLQAVVQLITDSHSQFPVLVQRTRTKAMLQGSFDGTLGVRQIPRRMDLIINDTIVTSGLAGIFPKGFPVGKVRKIEKKDFGLFQNAVIEPAVDLSRIEEVAVIIKSKSNLHQPLFVESP